MGLGIVDVRLNSSSLRYAQIVRTATREERMQRMKAVIMFALMAVMVGMWAWRSSGRAWAADYMGRPIAQTMHYTGAGWLTRRERQREEGSRRLLKALNLQPGDTACDIGAGNGFYALQMARQVGETGKVYAIDIQPEMLELLNARAKAEGVTNIITSVSTTTDPRLPAEVCDLQLLVDVYHEFSAPETMLAGLRAALAPDGELVLAEFRAEDAQLPIKRLHKMSKRQIMKELPANHFKLVREFDGLPWQHLMFFQRSSGPAEPIEYTPWYPGR